MLGGLHGAKRFTLCFGFACFALVVPVDVYENAFRRVFGSAIVSDEVAAASLLEMVPRSNPGCPLLTYDVFQDGNVIALSESRSCAVARIFQVMSDSFCGNTSDSQMVMHAASVLLSDRAVMFSGPSGSGKTSLALALSSYGFFLGDECAYVRDGEGLVLHENFPPQLKANNKALSLFASEAMVRVCGSEYGEAFYISPEQVSFADFGWRPIAAIVFPSYADGASFSVEKVSEKDLPELILGSLMGSDVPSKSFARFVRMCDTYRIRLFRVGFGDARRDAAFLRRFFD